MEWLNYHHLLYFWVVAREGGLAAAGKVLNLSHPTLSAQIHALEDHFNQKFFTRSGRRLVLTDAGKVLFRYADEIFTLGHELVDTLRGRAKGKVMRLQVGVTDIVPKMVVRRLLQPALMLAEPVRFVCREAAYENLLADLALHTLDIVIADAPVPTGANIKAFSNLLGETGVSIFGIPSLVRTYQKKFPASLDGAPFLLPMENLPLRRSLNQWFSAHHIKPHIVGEFDDSALLKSFGADGLGLFAAPTVVEKEICLQYAVKIAGRIPTVREQYYAISVERRVTHPAVIAISDAARQTLFAPSPQRRPT